MSKDRMYRTRKRIRRDVAAQNLYNANRVFSLAFDSDNVELMQNSVDKLQLALSMARLFGMTERTIENIAYLENRDYTELRGY